MREPQRFEDLRLAPALLRAVRNAGFRAPTPVQSRAIPALLAGRDVIARARTGSGKTAAYVIPIVQRYSRAPARPGTRRHVRALVLAPTRELAAQIGDAFGSLGGSAGLQTVVITGGGDGDTHLRALRRGIDVIVATPGRMIDLLGRGLVPLGRVETFVLDELDRMLDMGFVDDVRRVMASLPERKQTAMFSATLPSEVLDLVNVLLRDPLRIEIRDERRRDEPAAIDERIVDVARPARYEALCRLLADERARRVLVFVASRATAAYLGEKLARDRGSVDALHGDLDQARRDKSLERFRRGDVRVLVATDVAARGLDVEGVTHVINYDPPTTVEAYVHRIGRTGRAGANGIAVTFVDPAERAAFEAMIRTRPR